ncbi:MAG: hypothetical protein PHN38_00425 [Sulfurospirillaceae bacterium]|nr:hypothetical protein [Sulfurospirillaceae bacterium]MDD3462176.1 hypothetical protein [Sulfurospirillaceae bacterium]
MDKIKALEKIGLREVSRKTHIEVKYLEYMVNGEFEKLNKINTLGFIKILSREYKLDLSEWVDAFNNYWYENRKDDELKNDKIFVVAPSAESAFRKIIVFFVFVSLISFCFVAYYIFQSNVNFLNQTGFDTNKTDTSYDTTPSVKEAQKVLGDTVIRDIVRDSSKNQSEITVSILDSNESNTESVDENASTDENISIEIENPMIPIKEQEDNISSEIIFAPKERIWIGIIYIPSYDKKSKNFDSNMSVDISKNQLISTGHGRFSIVIDGKKEDFNEQGSIKFEVKDGKIKRLSSNEFLELNKGKNW